MDMFTKASSRLKNKPLLGLIIAFFSISQLWADDIGKNMETMQKAIVMLMEKQEASDLILEDVKKQNSDLEKQVKQLKEKLEKSKRGQGSVEILSGASVIAVSEMVKGTGKVLAKSINVREYPSLTSKIVSFLEEGIEVEFVELVTDQEGIRWACLKRGGYVSTKWLDITIKEEK